MSQIPKHTELDELAQGHAQQQRTEEFEPHRNNLIRLIREQATKRPYKVTYRFGGDYSGLAFASKATKRQLRDWVNEQPGYRARLQWDYPYGLVVKVLKDKKRQWPFFLKWIPGLR